MLERLIELLKCKSCYSETDSACLKRNGYECAECDKVIIELEDCERIADYLLANGVIVPPCKVGDMVYLFYPVRKGIYEAFVDEISLSKKSNFIVTRDLYFNRRQAVFFEQFGKTVFLTKEEAENALKERERV